MRHTGGDDRGELSFQYCAELCRRFSLVGASVQLMNLSLCRKETSVKPEGSALRNKHRQFRPGSCIRLCLTLALLSE